MKNEENFDLESEIFEVGLILKKEPFGSFNY